MSARVRVLNYQALARRSSVNGSGGSGRHAMFAQNVFSNVGLERRPMRTVRTTVGFFASMSHHVKIQILPFVTSLKLFKTEMASHGFSPIDLQQTERYKL